MTKPSYEEINYSVRPAKATERKMICECINRLSVFNKIANYRYIGFGSPYYCDFSLFHKNLGINKMICLEKFENDKPRFEFNKPYKCIDLLYGESNSKLPTLNWDTHTVMWLDYDDCLDDKKLSDISLFFSKAISGSMIIVTINPSFTDNHFEDDIKESRLNELKNRIGEKRIPPNVTANDLIPKNYISILRKIILNEIKETISIRNGGLPSNKKMSFHQLFNFSYKDGAKMFTYGGIIVEKQDEPKINSCDFSDFCYYRPDETEFQIYVPKLTFREIRTLEKKLPNLNNGNTQTFIAESELTDLKCVPKKDIEAFMNIYRYFPNYAETEI